MKLPIARIGACAGLLAALAVAPARAEAPGQPSDYPDVHRAARVGAVADSVSTLVGTSLTQIGAEANPLVSTTPAGLALLLAGKVGLIRYIETLPDEAHDQALRRMASLWSGMSANNLAIAAGGGPLAIPLGLLAGYMVYAHEDPEQAPHDLGQVEPLPAGVRADPGQVVGTLRLAVVRHADMPAARSELLHHELAVLAPGAQLKFGDTVTGPDGQPFIIDQLLGEVPVIEVGRAQALVPDQSGEASHPAVAELTHQTFVPRAWVYTYAARRALPDGSPDPAASDVRLELGSAEKARPRQVVSRPDGQRYAILRPLSAYPLAARRAPVATPDAATP